MDVFDLDGHLRMSLGIYALGALRQDLAAVVETHLARCASCRHELQDLRKVTSALALLSAEEAEELIGNATTAQDGQHVGALAFNPVGQYPTDEPTRPSAGARLPEAVPAGRRIRPQLVLVSVARTVALAAVVALIIGFSAGLVLRASTSRAQVVTAAAHGDGQLMGVSLSVSASGRDNTASIHATVEGLRPDETYYLFVVTADGVAQLVTQWSSPGGVRIIDHEVAVPIALMAYFTVVEADGTVVMLAWCRPGLG